MEDEQMHHGFAIPLGGMIGAVLLTPFFVDSYLGACATTLLPYFGLEATNRLRARHRLRVWARSHGLHDLKKLHRGGFWHYGFTLLTFAEMDRFSAVDQSGRRHRIMASYGAYLLGLRLRTTAELLPDEDDG